jgi:hypothetical protein
MPLKFLTERSFTLVAWLFLFFFGLFYATERSINSATERRCPDRDTVSGFAAGSSAAIDRYAPEKVQG